MRHFRGQDYHSHNIQSEFLYDPQNIQMKPVHWYGDAKRVHVPSWGWRSIKIYDFIKYERPVVSFRSWLVGAIHLNIIFYPMNRNWQARHERYLGMWTHNYAPHVKPSYFHIAARPVPWFAYPLEMSSGVPKTSWIISTNARGWFLPGTNQVLANQLLEIE